MHIVYIYAPGYLTKSHGTTKSSSSNDSKALGFLSCGGIIIISASCILIRIDASLQFRGNDQENDSPTGRCS